MKAFLILILGSIGLASGGVALLYLNGDNFFSLEIWKLAAKLMISAPGEMIEEAIGGPEKEFFRGLAVSISGIVLALLFFTMMNVAWMISSARKSISSRRRRREDQGKVKSRVERTGAAQEEKRSLAKLRGALGKLAGLAERLKGRASRKVEVFVDREASLEDSESEDKLSWMSWVRKKVAATTEKKKTVIIKSGRDEESIIQIEDEQEFASDLKEWYGLIKRSPQNDPHCIEEARKLAGRASRRARSKVVEEDAMNGEFMLRMMDAWAAKVDGKKIATAVISSEETDGDGEASAFSRAIEEVIRDGVAPSGEDGDGGFPEVEDFDEDFIIKDFDDDDDETNDEDEDFYIPDEVEEEQSGGSQDDGGDESGREGGELRAIVAARHIMEIEELAAAVSNFEAEWEDDLADPSTRRKHVEEMFSGLKAALKTEAQEISGLSSFDAEGDQREIAWIQENQESLDEKLAAMLENVAAFPQEEYGDEDLDDAFSIMGTEGPEGAEEESGTGSEAVLDEDGFGSKEAPDAEAQEKEEITENAVEQREPSDVSIDELEEIERSGELIYNWGYIAKGAGAAEAKISHSVLAKDGLKRRVVGIVHLVAGWRGRENDESKRLNIVLRYVPEGEWVLDMENGIKMVDRKGDFVQVSAEMLSQPEIMNGVLLVHFYGPGAPDGVLVEEGNVLVTTATLSIEKIQQRMDG